jgi:aconitate hydratase 2/2-methylisocitrate dehydratase
VYLASAELAAMASKLGRIPTVAEYQSDMAGLNKDSSKVYQYLNFDQIQEYKDVAAGVSA